MLQKLNYQFKNEDLLIAALTHRSTAYKNNTGDTETHETDNQRLEFLGDAILDLIISEFLFLYTPHLNEGEMSRFRAALVCENSLVEIAKNISLGEFLILGTGEAQGGGRNKNSLLADGLEALLGAIYIDAGFFITKKIIYSLWEPYFMNPEDWPDILADYKTALQEITQASGLGPPIYNLIATQGPAHERIFNMEVLFNNESLAQAKAYSKKEAEQKAAKIALKILQHPNNISEEK